MKRVVKIIIFALIGVAAAGGIIYTVTAPIDVPLSYITAKDVELSFSEQGLAVAENVVQVYPVTQGQVLRINVQEGQNVSEGDVICEVDSGPLILRLDELSSVYKGYEAQYANLDTEQERLRADLQTSRSRLTAEAEALDAQARSSSLSLEQLNTSVDEQLRLQNLLIEQSLNDLTRAREDLEKAGLLYQAGSITQNEYDNASLLVEKSEAALEAAELERGLIAGGRGISSAEYYRSAKAALAAQIEGIDRSLSVDYTGTMKDYYTALMQGNKVSIKQIELQIEDCVLKAPVSGVITKLNVRNMNFISPAAPAAEITVPGNIIEVFVSTQDVDSVRPGDMVELTLKRREGDALFAGEVTEIGSMAEVRLSTLGVEERKVKVKIEPNVSLLDGVSFGLGYSVDVRFYVYRAAGKFAVPKTALYKESGIDKLWVVRGGLAQAVEVTVGMELRTETVIEAGLAEGDYVVTDANNKDLKNGVKVKV